MRQLLAEALGTMLLVCTVVGSGIMAAELAGGNDGVALFGQYNCYRCHSLCADHHIGTGVGRAF